MANQDSSLALDRTRLWERLRQEAGLSSEPGAAPVEALALHLRHHGRALP